MRLRLGCATLTVAMASLSLACGDPNAITPGQPVVVTTEPISTNPVSTGVPLTVAPGVDTAIDTEPPATVAAPTTAPTAAVPTPPSCDSNAVHLAPTIELEGWKRFVLHAAPVDSCDAPYLRVSYVHRPPDRAIGTMLTIQTGYLGDPIPQGASAVIDINGMPTVVYHGSMADGTPVVQMSTTIEGVGVEAHGSVTDDELALIIGSMHVVDATTWQQIVDSVVVDPLSTSTTSTP